MRKVHVFHAVSGLYIHTKLVNEDGVVKKIIFVKGII